MQEAAPTPDEQIILTRDRLRWLSIAAYVRGGLMALFSCFFLIYVCLFGVMASLPESAWGNKNRPPTPGASSLATAAATPAPMTNDAPPRAFFGVMAAFFGGLTLVFWTFAGLTAYAGRCITLRKHRVFVVVIAAVNCLFLPYGTLFGVATILVLSSPAAKAEFAAAQT